jgi:hypothetical protein
VGSATCFGKEQHWVLGAGGNGLEKWIWKMALGNMLSCLVICERASICLRSLLSPRNRLAAAWPGKGIKGATPRTTMDAFQLLQNLKLPLQSHPNRFHR